MSGKDGRSGKERPGLALGMCLGLAVGTAVGAATRNIGLWLPVGLALGTGLGLLTGGKDGEDGGRPEKEDGKDGCTEPLMENMIAWAGNEIGNAAYAGWCLSFIEDALEKSNGIEIFGGDSAKESAALYADAMRAGVPERGSFVFYDCLCPGEDGPVNRGHCGIGLGDGRVIHAWDVVRIDDYLDIEKMTAVTGDHPRYIGWIPVSRVLEQKPPEEGAEGT